MAKTLNERPPTSSVARLLDRHAVARALGPAVSTPVRSEAACSGLPQEIPVVAQPSIIKREFVLTPETEEMLENLVQTYRQATGARISNSQLIRAILRCMSYGHGAIEREARRLGALRLPSNAKGRETEREAFERNLGASFVAAMRSLPAFDAR